MILGLVSALALVATDPCAPVAPAARADRAVAAEYRAVAEAEAKAGNRETAAAAWRLVVANDPDDAGAREALAALCREAGGAKVPGDSTEAAIRLLDAGKYREAAELLRRGRTGRRAAPEAALLEGICRYELGEDAEATRLLREAEADKELRDSARLYLGLLALRGGAAREAATLFDSAAGNPNLSALAADLARSARWDGPFVLSLLAEAGWDSNVRLTDVETASMRGSGSSNGDAVAGLSAVVLGRPFGANGLFLRGAGALQQYARMDEYDFTSLEAAAGARWWRSGDGVTAEYSFADRTLGGEDYLATHRVLAAGSFATGPLTFGGSWWGRWEEYADAWAGFSGFAQRAEGRVGLTLGARAKVGLSWAYGRDDADDPANSWDEQGPRVDLRLVLGPRARVAAELGGVQRRYDRVSTYDDGSSTVSLQLEEIIVDGSAALEWDLSARATLRFSLAFRYADANYDPFDYTKVVPSAAMGIMITP